MPFAKLYEVIYRLEYETGEQGMSTYACTEDNSCTGLGTQTIEQSFCAGKIEATELSFRQMSYKWDVADTTKTNQVILSSPFVGDTAANFESGFLTTYPRPNS